MNPGKCSLLWARVLSLFVLCAALPLLGASSALGYGGGGGDDSENAFANIMNRAPAKTIQSGTVDISFPLPSWDELKKLRQEDLEHAQRADERARRGWEAIATATTYGEGAAVIADWLGWGAQIGLNFVPGVGPLINIGLDTLRGGAEGYAAAMEKGLSQKEAIKVGTKNAAATSLFSAFTNKLGFGKNYRKVMQNAQKAKTVKQIIKSNKEIGVAIIGNAADETAQDIIGKENRKNIVENTSPKARLRK